MMKKESGWPVLQLALDLDILERALQIAKEASGSVDWVEVGTPLIKSEGLESVRRIKKAFPDKTILADMKTMDAGSFEAEMAAKAGADIVMVLGAADDSTIAEAVKAGRRCGAGIMADVINVPNPVERARQLEAIGVSYLCVHIGIDQQMKGAKPIDILRETASVVKIPVAVAGGMNAKSAAHAVKAGASIVIAGAAITKAENCASAAKTIKKAMLTGKPLRARGNKESSEDGIRKIFGEVSSSNISDAMHRTGQLNGITAICPGAKAVGRAFTVRTYPGDWAKPVEAIDHAPRGSVIVVDAGGTGPAVWGELATWSCVKSGICGVVIDGAIRDVDVIRKLEFPAFARHITPAAGEPKGFGESEVEILCGGAKIRPGDWIVGDDSGVVVIPKEEAVEAANRAADVLEKENRVREEIKRGSTLSKVLKLKKWEKVIG